MKTVRFAQVVPACGRPGVYLQFAAPARDPTLRGLVKRARVMTVHQKTRGGRKDYGTVGLHAGERSQFLVFPRSLKRFGDRRVVGIDYTLLTNVGTGRRQPARHQPETRKTAVARAKKKGDIVPFAKSPAPPVEPPKPASSREVVAEIRGILRQLSERKIAAARDRLKELERRVALAEESQ